MEDRAPEPSELSGGGNPDGIQLEQIMQGYERALILLALEAHGGNQRRAAASLRILPTTLHMKMRRLKLATDRFASRRLGFAHKGDEPDETLRSSRLGS